MFPKAFSQLVLNLKKLPGIGEKTAERLALYIVNNYKKDELISFSNVLTSITHLKKCSCCNIMTENNLCDNCQNIVSDYLIIVENSIDAFQIMKTNEFDNSFHVIDYLIDYTKGIDEEMIDISKLLNRLTNIKEIIIALNSTIQGELTSKYIINKVLEKNSKIKISKLANGLPFGSELKYISSETLKRALENRIEVSKPKI